MYVLVVVGGCSQRFASVRVIGRGRGGLLGALAGQDTRYSRQMGGV
jgi:hypothetical protein